MLNMIQLFVQKYIIWVIMYKNECTSVCLCVYLFCVTVRANLLTIIELDEEVSMFIETIDTFCMFNLTTVATIYS